jgi:MerR family transcriptional regulator/heat shock protein HspR
MNINDDEDIFDFDDFDLSIDPEEPVFPLNVVCRLLDMHYWTVHEILDKGLIRLKRVGKKKKLFSHKNVRRLKYIKYLIEVRGVNIQGIKVIFEMREDI